MMRSIRFSLANVMGVVVLVALGFAALRAATPGWASATFSAAVVLLLTAVVGAVVRRGRDRASWIGAALFGWAYLAASFGPWPWLNNDGLRPPPLLTTRLVDTLLARHPQSEVFRAHSWSRRIDPTIVSSSGELSVIPPDTTQAIDLGFILTTTPIKQIGHSLLSIVVALLGAIVGRLLSPNDPDG